MKLKPKTKRRKFELKLCLPYTNQLYEQWAKEVIESIEQDELLVFDPKDTEGLRSIFDNDGAQLLHAKAKMPISIKEWLPVGCQCIRYGEGEEMESHETAYALYDSNARKVLWPVYPEHKPEGPASFCGEILFSNEIATRFDEPFFEDKFKFMVAHELVHVFDYLRFIVPAFTDWRSFWHTFVDDGLANDILVSHLGDMNFVDRYGTQLELDCVQDYWPSQAKGWFNALRQDTKVKKKKRKNKN